MESRHFDLLRSPLDGVNLIEASAGTGKTYTISSLFLRLLLEKGIPADEILVVTFTEAATAELRERIRGKLRLAIKVFSGHAGDDDFINGLTEIIGDNKKALSTLREALRSFDRASIFTIHGFCRRMLADNAFESGCLFDTELVAETADLVQEIVDDFWRKNFYLASTLFIAYAVRHRFVPEDLLRLVSKRLLHPDLQIIPDVAAVDYSQEEAGLLKDYETIRHVWREARDDIAATLTNCEGLNRTKYPKSRIPLWITAMDHFTEAEGTDLLQTPFLKKFTKSEIGGAVRKDYTAPEHPFFSICEEYKARQDVLIEAYDRRLLALKRELYVYVHEELMTRKRARNIQSFDDLLLNLYAALTGARGDDLVRSVRSRFNAALIDEFQDTDPIQYAIFKRVFATGACPLFFIGDPKQAIYGFRGADIFTYMEAVGDVNKKYTLGKNWRSHPGLVTAINTIFSRRCEPFVYHEIPFDTVSPALTSTSEQSGTPLRIWYMGASEAANTGRKISKTTAREIIPRAVAAEIARLLTPGREERSMIDGRHLREGDIAVLVRRNREAHRVHAMLSEIGISSVLSNTGNLFASHEAHEMERVLRAIAEPRSERRMRTALATDMIGLKGEELEALMNDENTWERWLLAFRTYHDLWSTRGFIRMLRNLLSEEHVIVRLMSMPNGERRCTNVLHLAETLHETAVQRNFTITGLVKWLSQMRLSANPETEEHQLRLESDENAVKIVTIHKSKGLEYPVVFCPFTWDGSRVRNAGEPLRFHDEKKERVLTLDIGSHHMDESIVASERELLAENLRLLYVALTRAKERCYLVWGRFNEAETSAPAYLLHGRDEEKRENPVDVTAEQFNRLSDDDVYADLKNLMKGSSETIEVSAVSEAAEVPRMLSGQRFPKLSCRVFSTSIARDWRMSSFSSLVSGRMRDSEMADRDMIRGGEPLAAVRMVLPSPDKDETTIFTFPRGARAGTVLHDIFEHLDFTWTPHEIQRLADDRLEAFGFDRGWSETVCDMIRRVLSVEFATGDDNFALSRIPNKSRINELEFYYPLKTVSKEMLARIFGSFSGTSDVIMEFPEHIERLQFAPLWGFMKGFIDMVFTVRGRYYIVDWKSNYLGGSVEEYGQGALMHAMNDNMYTLQYYLYTVALHQYLTVRHRSYNYDRHFGGVFYIFLRGVDPVRGSDFGIFKDRPPGELIDELCCAMIPRYGS